VQVYGLTGGIGSGKTEAAKRFAWNGIPVIDADKVGHELIEPGGEAVPAVVAAFGDQVLTGGRINRGKLGTLVFSDRQALARLNAILHPLIRREIDKRCRAMAQAGHIIAILEAALLAEEGRPEFELDGLIVVTCSEATRLRRVVAARGLTPEQAGQRIQAQMPPEKKVAWADWVIENEGTLGDLHTKVDKIVRELKHHDT
jgi:dephospho-CoA kinase